MNRNERARNAMLAMEGAAQRVGWPGAIGALFDTIEKALRRDETVGLRGFGSFSAAETLERGGRNPRTGKPIRMQVGRRVGFKPAERLLGK